MGRGQSQIACRLAHCVSVKSGLGETFNALFEAPVAEGGFGLPVDKRNTRIPIHLDSPAGEGWSSLAGTQLVVDGELVDCESSEFNVSKSLMT